MKNNKAGIIVSLIILIILVGLGVYFAKRKMPEPTKETNQPAETFPAQEQKTMNTITTSSGLQYTIAKEGTGDAAKAGDTVSVHYTGTLDSGQKFDSSRDRGAPFQFSLGAGQVIAGWDEGVAGMKIGEMRTLIIPASLGYGANGIPGVIPANATLHFDVELISISKKAN